MDNADLANRVLSDAGGMTSRAQLLKAGVEPTWLRRRLRRGMWAEPLPGVIDAVGASGHGFGRMRAALIAAGEGAYISHDTAAAVVGLMPMPLLPQPIHVTVPHGTTRRRLPGVAVHQSRRHQEVFFLEGSPVTRPAVTVVDLASRLSLNDLRCIAADAVRGSRCTIDDIASVRNPAPTSRRFVQLIVEELWAGAASGPEMAIWRAFTSSRLPVPALNAEVSTEEGIRCLDGFWRRLRLGYEIDGRSVHAQAQAFDEDRLRHNAIQSQGILLLRFAAERVFTAPDTVLAVTEATIRQRGSEMRLTWAEVVRSGVGDRSTSAVTWGPTSHGHGLV